MRRFILVVCIGILLSGCTSSGVKKVLQETDILQANKQYTEALTQIDQALVTHPQDKKLHEKRTELLIFTEQYEQFLQERPGLSSSVQKKLVREHVLSLLRTGETDAALEIITGLLTKQTTSDFLQLKGQAEYIQGNIDQAIATYDEALRQDPSNQEALMNKAIAFADAGRLYESLTLLDQGLQDNPDDYLLRYNKGTVLSDLGYQQRNVAGTGSFSYYGDALRHFEKAYRLNPHYQNTAVWLGITYLDLSQYKKAHQAFETVLSADPTAYDAWYYQAKTYTAEGNIPEAKKTYSHLLAINPSFELAEQELILLEKQEPAKKEEE